MYRQCASLTYHSTVCPVGWVATVILMQDIPNNHIYDVHLCIVYPQIIDIYIIYQISISNIYTNTRYQTSPSSSSSHVWVGRRIPKHIDPAISRTIKVVANKRICYMQYATDTRGSYIYCGCCFMCIILAFSPPAQNQ